MRAITAARALSLILLVAAATHAQQTATGRIVGRVIDGTTGHGIPEAGIQITGSTIGAQTGVDGRFTIANVPAGTHSLSVRRIGFSPKTVTGLVVEAGETLEQSITLAPAATAIAAQVVTAAAERGTVNEALDAQRIAVGVVSAITAEQIGRSPDADAAQAVQRVSGVTVQDGRYVFVRGLGERYTTASLNGARVPSPEPEKRVVPLDLFPAGLLQSVTTSKTFAPDQSGDFAGAQVDIRTREFPARRTFTLQLNEGFASGATGARLIAGRAVGGEPLAMASGKRELPELVRSVGNFQGVTLNQGDKNLLISQFRNAWTPANTSAAPKTAAGFSLGGDDPILFGHNLGYLFSGSYSYGTELKDNQVRALADRGNTPGETRTIDRFVGETASQNVLWGGIANLSTMLGETSRLSFNGLYNRTADNDARVERGLFENEGVRAQISRMQYVERAVQSSQLAGEHQLGSQRVDWAVTASAVRRDEPDRSEFVQSIEQDTPGGPDVLRWWNTGNGGAVRTFSALHENSREAKGNYQFGFTTLGRDHLLKIGALGRRTTRTADTRAYSISAPGAKSSIRELSAEQIFDGRFSGPEDSVFTIGALAQGGSYDARDELGAAYAMAEVGLSSRLRLIGGARYEADHLLVNAASTLGSPLTISKNWNDLMPSLALNAQLTTSQQLRFSASRTVARPEYREIAPIKSRDVLNGDDTQGNDRLERTNVANADIRWEWYPESGEILSAALFAKRFDRPIERVYQAAGSGTRTVFYTNAKSATNYGIEIEARKSLGFVARPLQPLTVFTNVTAMQSQISLGEDTRASATNLRRRMVGQAPYVFNGGLTYSARERGMSATVLYNRVGERIVAAGDRPLPDVIEMPRDVVDLSIRLPVAGALSARFDAKNLLDAPYRTIQGTVTREEYRMGRMIQAGLAWRP
jgi:outer membrane receptor protein involved in Fe transport